MPVLTPPLPPQVFVVRPLYEELAVAQGDEGKQVREQIELISQHWSLQSLTKLTLTNADTVDELNDYRSPPFQSAGVRRVKYVRVKELQPRHFAIEEDE